MDKIITINLGGYTIKIEEDAFDVLKSYIRQIEQAFANTENGKEIINDIEARLAEMINERVGEKAATRSDIEFVMNAMGNPGDFEGSEPTENQARPETNTESIPKRLYRDSDNKVLGGVCAGLSNYFNMDPVVIRIIWVCLFFFFGSGLLLYLILWVIVPEALTTAQKLEMRGEAPTLDNIINRVKTEAGRVEQSIKSQNFGQRVGDIARGVSPVLVSVFKIFAMLLGFGLLIGFSIIMIALLSGASSFVFHNNGFEMHDIPNMFDSNWEFLTFKVLAFLLIGIPFFNIITGLLKFAFNSKANYGPVRQVLRWVWIACVPLMIYFVYLAVHNFRSYETVEINSTEKVDSNLRIVADFSDEDDLFDVLNINVTPSEDSLVHINILQSASSKNRNLARDMASRNGATYTLKNHELTLRLSDYYRKSGFFRRQKVEFNIQIPNKLNFTIDHSAAKICTSIEGQNVRYYTNDDEKPKNLVFLKSELYCPSCPDSIPYGSSGLHNYSNFNDIEAEGWFDIEIVQGDQFRVQKIGPENVTKYVELDQWDNVLHISMEHQFLNQGNKPRIIITMPELHKVKFSGANNCKVGKFAGNELTIEMNGASKAVMDVQYDKVNSNLSGVSRLDLRGNATTLTCDMSGATHFNGQNFTADVVKVDISGACETILGPAKSIDGSASGAAKIEYSGSPVIHVSTSGVSKLTPLIQ